MTEITNFRGEATPQSTATRSEQEVTALIQRVGERVRRARERKGIPRRVLSEMSGELVEMTRRKEIDAALIHRPEVIEEEFEWKDVTQQKVVVVAPPGSVVSDPQAVFAKFPYIRFNRSAWVAGLIETRLEELGITPRTQAEIQSIEAIHLMVSLGFGASILPDVGKSDDAMRRLDFGSPPIHRTIGLLSRRDRTRKKVTSIVGKAFIEATKVGRLS